MGTFDAIRALRIGLASPEDIRRWSSGEVKEPTTINYRTQKPEQDGLFCERIFGPTRDWSCACGKYQRKRQAGIICQTCGVELAPATVRRERMGHIELASPIVHPWYRRTIGVLLDLSPWQLSALLGYQRYLVLYVDEEARNRECDHPNIQNDPESRMWQDQLLAMKCGDLIEEGSYRTLSVLYPGVFQAQTRAEAVRTLCIVFRHRDRSVSCTSCPSKQTNIFHSFFYIFYNKYFYHTIYNISRYLTSIMVYYFIYYSLLILFVFSLF